MIIMHDDDLVMQLEPCQCESRLVRVDLFQHPHYFTSPSYQQSDLSNKAEEALYMRQNYYLLRSCLNN